MITFPETLCFADPERDCPFCPRLRAFIAENRVKYPDFFNAPVPSFGPIDVPLLIVGLAPGLKGANRSGRPFTGDFAGDMLYRALADYGFSRGEYKARPDDGLVLTKARITNAVRCVPPKNAPTGEEARTCGDFLTREIAAMPNLKVILVLGGLAHNAVLSVLNQKKSLFKFAHNAEHILSVRGKTLTLIDSYHTSRYNVNTGQLTEEMFRSVFDHLTQKL